MRTDPILAAAFLLIAARATRTKLVVQHYPGATSRGMYLFAGIWLAVKCVGVTTKHKIAEFSRTSAALYSALVVLTLVFPPLVHAADPMGPSLCAVIKELIPEVKTYLPEGARAQLVMALVEKYENDELHQAWAQIDEATSASCPAEREAMLGIVKTNSLAEALR
jgi:hypothetical protein